MKPLKDLTIRIVRVLIGAYLLLWIASQFGLVFLFWPAFDIVAIVLWILWY